MKECYRCKKILPVSDYYADKQKVDGKHPCCKSCDNEKMAKLRKTKNFRAVFNPYQKIWQRKYRKTKKYHAWRKVALEKQSMLSQQLKQQIVSHYGGMCACCGVKELFFLSIDHINNDGYKERGNKKNRTSGYLLYKRIIKDNYPDNLQILCFNCNVAKQHNGGECPHKNK